MHAIIATFASAGVTDIQTTVFIAGLTAAYSVYPEEPNISNA